MIVRAEIEKLGAMHAVEPTMLSLYLAIPPQPAPLPVLSARADELIAAAGAAGGVNRHVAEQDRNSVKEKLAMRGRDWPGRTVAIFACADVGLLEAIPLPYSLPERGVLGTRPHIRPLLAAPDWGTAPLPVPDVIEEMVSRTLEDGGQISVICDGSSPVAARLHVPVAH
jgi:hypothetical protein